MNQAMQAIADKYGVAPCPPPQKSVRIGIPALDALTGGIPKGRIVDIHGAEDTGKTALALAMAKGSVLYIDAENKLAPYMVKDRKNFYIAHVQTLEDALEVCRIAAKGFDTIVLDTIEALPAHHERLDFDEIDYIDYKTYDHYREKLLSKAFPVLVPELLSNGCTMVVVNQMRNLPGVMYGKPDHSTGGRSLGYYASLRLELARLEFVYKGQSRTGLNTAVRVVKNKYGPPGGSVTLTLDYLTGFRSRNKGASRKGAQKCP